MIEVPLKSSLKIQTKTRDPKSWNLNQTADEKDSVSDVFFDPLYGCTSGPLSPQPSTLSPFLLSSLELGDTTIYEPQIRALLGTAPYFCPAPVLKQRTVSLLRSASPSTLTPKPSTLNHQT